MQDRDTRKSQVWSWHLRGGHWNGGVRCIKERLYHRVVGGVGGSLEGWRLRGERVAGERVTVCRRMNAAGWGKAVRKRVHLKLVLKGWKGDFFPIRGRMGMYLKLRQRAMQTLKTSVEGKEFLRSWSTGEVEDSRKDGQELGPWGRQRFLNKHSSKGRSWHVDCIKVKNWS